MLSKPPMVTEYDVGSTSNVDLLAQLSNATSAAAKTVTLGPQERRLKCRSMRLFTSKDLTKLYHSYRSKHHKRDLTWVTPLSTVSLVRVGLPVPVPPSDPSKSSLLAAMGGMLLRSPNPSLSLTLEGEGGMALLHVEATSATQLDSLLRTLSILTQYARARGGVVESLPDISGSLLPGPSALLPNSGGGAAF